MPITKTEVRDAALDAGADYVGFADAGDYESPQSPDLSSIFPGVQSLVVMAFRELSSCPSLTCGWRCPVGWTSWISLALALIRLRAPWRRRGLLSWRCPSPILWRWVWRPRASSEMSPCAMLRWPLGWGILGATTWFFTRDWGAEWCSPLFSPTSN